jgi:hypothetical protein
MSDFSFVNITHVRFLALSNRFKLAVLLLIFVLAEFVVIVLVYSDSFIQYAKDGIKGVNGSW